MIFKPCSSRGTLSAVHIENTPCKFHYGCIKKKHRALTRGAEENYGMGTRLNCSGAVVHSVQAYQLTTSLGYLAGRLMFVIQSMIV